MVELKFSLWEGTFNETAFTVTQLATHVVAPEEKCAIVQRSHAVAFAAGNMSDV